MTLPSNTTSKEYSNNTIGEFTIALSQPLELLENWEVGLVQIQYTKSFDKEGNNENEVGVDFGMYIETKANSFAAGQCQTEHVNFSFHEGLGINVLVSNIVKNSPKWWKGSLSIKVDPNTKHIEFVVDVGAHYFFTLDDHFKDELDRHQISLVHNGITVNTNEYNPKYDNYHDRNNPIKKIKNLNVVQKSLSIIGKRIRTSMYIYCDIIKDNLVGDSYAPLLRNINIPKNIIYGDVVLKTFDPGYYHSLATTITNQIRIKITDETGIAIPFQFGTVVPTLHFRQKKIISMPTLGNL